MPNRPAKHLHFSEKRTDILFEYFIHFSWFKVQSLVIWAFASYFPFEIFVKFVFNHFVSLLYIIYPSNISKWYFISTFNNPISLFLFQFFSSIHNFFNCIFYPLNDTVSSSYCISLLRLSNNSVTYFHIFNFRIKSSRKSLCFLLRWLFLFPSIHRFCSDEFASII